jgi:hypothetical protein
MLLLGAYVALGLSRMGSSKAATVGVTLTVVVLAAVFASYGAIR